MTEERFNISYDDGLIRFIKDTKTNENLDIIDCEYRMNELAEENEQLKQVLGSILIEVRKDIGATNHSGEVKAVVNPNSFDLIYDVRMDTISNQIGANTIETLGSRYPYVIYGHILLRQSKDEGLQSLLPMKRM